MRRGGPVKDPLSCPWPLGRSSATAATRSVHAALTVAVGAGLLGCHRTSWLCVGLHVQGLPRTTGEDQPSGSVLVHDKGRTLTDHLRSAPAQTSKAVNGPCWYAETVPFKGHLQQTALNRCSFDPNPGLLAAAYPGSCHPPGPGRDPSGRPRISLKSTASTEGLGVGAEDRPQPDDPARSLRP